MLKAPGQKTSQTDPDARSTTCRGTGVVGYNVQTAVDTKYHIFVTHEITNVGYDKSALNHMATCAKDAIGKDTLEVVADRGYYSGIKIVKCEDAQITTYVPKAQT